MNGFGIDNVAFQPVFCALCGSEAPYNILYPERLTGQKSIDPQQLFSARRIPGKVHFRIVRCKICGLTYSNPIYSENTIKQLYEKSEFIDNPLLQSQFVNIKNDYAKQLKKALLYSKGHENLLDIGCGNGFFLKIANGHGFRNVYGVEPGQDAYNKADPNVRPHIINGYFQQGLFADNFFDMISSFHVMDHILRPNEFLRNIYGILKPEGILLLITHNVSCFLTRLFGESAPMFHIEHIYLFNKKTIRAILIRNGFDVLLNEDLTCTFTLAHVIKMAPGSFAFKKLLLEKLQGKSLADLQIKLMPGDMLTIARRPNCPA